MKSLTKYTIWLLMPALLLIAGCVDDTFDNIHSGKYPDGETLITAKLSFDPYASQELGSRAVPGKNMDRLDDLCVVAYDLDGNLLEGFPVEITKEKHNLEVKSEPRGDDDTSQGPTAEKNTIHATFNLKMPHGQFYVYGVANLGRYQGENRVSTTYQQLSEGGEFAQAVKKRTTFLNANTSWDNDNWRNNCEMLGYFCNSTEKGRPSTGSETNNRTVSVNGPDVILHSWLRRCASKVTIDFDGSGLRENIYIYIKRATIHDIPDSCNLGGVNAAKSTADLISNKNSDYRPSTGDYISYGEGTDYTQWPKISKGSPYIMENKVRKDFHAENADALFLYENMQGNSLDERNKEQLPAEDGTVIGADETKDNMPNGSYIEVEAFYNMSSNEQVSAGTIRYRFMLGKDVLKNFDVERNHHYKLTLCIRGNGNDVDWHIEYNEHSGFEIRNPYYVSYLYNHDSTLRFRYTPPEGKTVKSLTAEIIGNNWWPDDEKSSYSESAMKEQLPFVEGSDPLNPDSYTRNKYPASNADGLGGRTKFLGNGFLSLRATNKTILKLTDTWESSTTWTTVEEGKYMNDRYFYGVSKESNGIDRSKRTYYFDGTVDNTNTGREHYEVVHENGSLRFNIPVFTRVKNLVKASGYTGNNPYEGSSRSAYVKITVTLSDNSTAYEILRVKQVSRITNPKGIYRRSGNNDNFHVTLLDLGGDNSTTFSSFNSDGPWMAEVIGDHNFITLNGKSTIKGSTDTPIDFNVIFNKMNRDNKVRNAIIRVRYHNYSCVHLIFVRQGYSSQALEPGGTEWHTCNLIHKNLEASDPRDEGSLFKFGNLDNAIDVINNKYDKEWINVTPWFFKAPTSYKISDPTDLTGTKFLSSEKKWSDFKGVASGFAGTDVARISDIENLYNADNMNQGFGILYADGAVAPQYTTADAYGYCRHDAKTLREKRGMMGIFIYYWDSSVESTNNTSNASNNTRNMFFPIGRSGYGHRRNVDEIGGAGTLRYSCGRVREFSPGVEWRGLFHDLYKRRGAIYWSQTIQTATGVDGKDDIHEKAIGLDMNFFNLDVNVLDDVNVFKEGGSGPDDACFVRYVGKQTIE